MTAKESPPDPAREPALQAEDEGVSGWGGIQLTVLVILAVSRNPDLFVEIDPTRQERLLPEPSSRSAGRRRVGRCPRRPIFQPSKLTLELFCLLRLTVGWSPA
jgi:hypothetical protein